MITEDKPATATLDLPPSTLRNIVLNEVLDLFYNGGDREDFELLLAAAALHCNRKFWSEADAALKNYGDTLKRWLVLAEQTRRPKVEFRTPEEVPPVVKFLGSVRARIASDLNEFLDQAAPVDLMVMQEAMRDWTSDAGAGLGFPTSRVPLAEAFFRQIEYCNLIQIEPEGHGALEICGRILNELDDGQGEKFSELLVEIEVQIARGTSPSDLLVRLRRTKASGLKLIRDTAPAV